ncbi:MAG: hypothetical protein VX727_09965 [Planctomycetota bacterium]|nr:hypothetical protein [Planctomycetota bacterium]
MTAPLHPESLSWAALLGRWLDLAAASTALTDAQHGPQWRASIPSLVTLQAVVFALGEFDRLDEDERPVALDRSEVLVDEARTQLEECWPDGLPEVLADAITDARDAVDELETSMVWTLFHTADTPLRMPAAAVPSPGFEGGTLAMVPAGTIVMPGAPVAWWTCRREPELADAVPSHRIELRRRPVQVWREMDEAGRFIRDRVTDLERTVEQALPLLVPVLVDGAPQETFPVDPEDWSARLLERLPEEPLEVVRDDV